MRGSEWQDMGASCTQEAVLLTDARDSAALDLQQANEPPVRL